MLQFTPADSGESPKIHQGDSFEISLPETPATGFRWKITANGEPAVGITEDRFEPAEGVGGQGTHHWQFRTKQPGEAGIAMILQRSWGPPAEPEQSFTLRVVVLPG